MLSYRQVFYSLIGLGLLYAIFSYEGTFTQNQSIMLALVSMFAIQGCRLAYRTAAKQQPNFEPYWVSVEPNWYLICHDFELAAGEKWTELQTRCKASSGNYSVLRNGLNFTALSPTLFYSNDHNTFFRYLDLRITIEELRPEPGGLFSFAPQFYVKRKLVGEKKDRLAIEFGIVTSESLNRSIHPRDDRANIPIACLPEIVFFGFTQPDAYEHDTESYGTGERPVDRVWLESEKGRSRRLWLNWPEEINHKYFQVRYRGLS